MNDTHHEFDHLLSRHLDGELSPDESKRLSQFMASDAELARQFSRAAATHCQMRSVLKYDRAVAPPIVFDEETLPARWPWFAGGAMFALVIAFVAFTLRAVPGRHDIVRAEEPLHAGVSPAVAFLTVANGCDWGSSNSPLLGAVGSTVQSGDEVVLHEGIAEFRLAGGVSLSIEGPASLVLSSDSSLALLYGKLTAYVPWTVADLRVSVGACQFTACDGEFGVWQQGNKVDLHVFSGEVRAANPLFAYSQVDEQTTQGGTIVTDDAATFARATITAGYALSLVNEGDVLKVAGMGAKAAPEMFATNLPMAGPLPVSVSYVEAVLASRPLGYWRFESIKNGSVSNEVAEGIELKTVGNVRLAGRRGNVSLEFQPGDNCYLVSDKLIDVLANSDYSLEIWVKASHPHHGEILFLDHGNEPCHASGLVLQGVMPGQFWGGGIPGRVRFVHHNRIITNDISGTSCFSESPYRSRRWQHVVAVKEGSQMRLFIDGKLSVTHRERTTLATGLQLVVGHHLSNLGRKFVGQLDEVAIYSRALSEQEVARHYRLAVEDAEQAISSGRVPDA